MNTFVTIGFRRKGDSEILATPDVSYNEQKELFKNFESDDIPEIEMWSRSMGKVKSRKVKPAVKKIAEGKAEETSVNETQNKPAKNAGKKGK